MASLRFGTSSAVFAALTWPRSRWAWVIVAAVLGCSAPDVRIARVQLERDREERVAGQPLTPSTQSVNRYRSVLNRFDAVNLDLDGKRRRLRVSFGEKGQPSKLLAVENIDLDFVVPRLNYAHGRSLTPFDRLNLMLAEYSRSGVEMSIQERNSEYGFVRTRGLFDDSDDEYRF
jgi:hypothetical protein